jgi:hypothetical protein
MRRRAVLLALLAAVFLARVAGQAIVVLAAPDWLPPMTEWQSGLLPYPPLLATQLMILALQARVSVDLWRGRGRFAGRHPRFGTWLRWSSGLYAGSMLVRYVVTMALFPERRWFGGTIPIVFHWVLAGYLLVWSGAHRERAR